MTKLDSEILALHPVLGRRSANLHGPMFLEYPELVTESLTLWTSEFYFDELLFPTLFCMEVPRQNDSRRVLSSVFPLRLSGSPPVRRRSHRWVVTRLSRVASNVSRDLGEVEPF